jgi:hypothetical protein
LTLNRPSDRSLAQRWKRTRRSPRFSYVIFLLFFIIGIGWQAYQYWWGVKIQRWLAAGAGSATRMTVFPASWKSKIGPGYLEPFEPITGLHLNALPRMMVVGPNGHLVPVNEPPSLTPKDIRALKWLPFLRDLSIFGEMTPENWEALSELKQLRKLSVGSVPTSGFAHLGSLRRLRELKLLLDETTEPSDVRTIAELPNLSRLSLQFSWRRRGEYIAAEATYEQQMRQLARSRSLSRLEIGFPNNATLLALTERLPNGESPLVNLTELRPNLYSNQSSLTNAGLANLHNIPNLVHLDLSHSKVDNLGLMTLKSIPTLRTLYLVGCRGVDDQGADRLAEMPGLQSLNLAYTSLTQSGLMKLAALKRLRYLRLSSHFQVAPELRRELSATCKIDTR